MSFCAGIGLCVQRSPTVCLIVCVITETPERGPMFQLGTYRKMNELSYIQIDWDKAYQYCCYCWSPRWCSS
jgi:hypothetical protein